MEKSKRQFATLIPESLWHRIDRARREAGHTVPEWLARDPRLGTVSLAGAQGDAYVPQKAVFVPPAVDPDDPIPPLDPNGRFTSAPPPPPVTIPPEFRKFLTPETMRRLTVDAPPPENPPVPRPEYQPTAVAKKPMTADERSIDIATQCPHLVKIFAENRQADASLDEVYPWCADPSFDPAYMPWNRPLLLDAIPSEQKDAGIIIDKVEWNDEEWEWKVMDTFQGGQNLRSSGETLAWLEKEYGWLTGKHKIEITAEGWKFTDCGVLQCRFVYRWPGGGIPNYAEQVDPNYKKP